MTTCDACAADHVVRFTRPSPSVFAYCKRSKTGAGEGLGTRLSHTPVCGSRDYISFSEVAHLEKHQVFLGYNRFIMGLVNVASLLLLLCSFGSTHEQQDACVVDTWPCPATAEYNTTFKYALNLSNTEYLEAQQITREL